MLYGWFRRADRRVPVLVQVAADMDRHDASNGFSSKSSRASHMAAASGSLMSCLNAQDMKTRRAVFDPSRPAVVSGTAVSNARRARRQHGRSMGSSMVAGTSTMRRSSMFVSDANRPALPVSMSEMQPVT